MLRPLSYLYPNNKADELRDDDFSANLPPSSMEIPTSSSIENPLDSEDVIPNSGISPCDQNQCSASGKAPCCRGNLFNDSNIASLNRSVPPISNIYWQDVYGRECAGDSNKASEGTRGRMLSHEVDPNTIFPKTRTTGSCSPNDHSADVLAFNSDQNHTSDFCAPTPEFSSDLILRGLP